MIAHDRGEARPRHNTEPTIKPKEEEIHNTEILEPEEVRKREQK